MLVSSPRSAGAEPGKMVKCDCCGKETMAEIKGNKLVIIDRRHGKRHLVVLTLDEITARMNELSLKSNQV